MIKRIKTYMNSNRIISIIDKMSPKELILLMVYSLRNPVTAIDMSTYGRYEEGICYGCAATNTICNLAGMNKEDVIKSFYATIDTTIYDIYANDYLKTSSSRISAFETSINNLRLGKIDTFNFTIMDAFPNLVISNDVTLPAIDDDLSEDTLKAYEDFANSL